MTRLDANREIVKTISAAVEEFPDWRFHQIMQNLGLELGNPDWDPWYEESEKTLAQLKTTAAALMSAVEKNRRAP